MDYTDLKSIRRYNYKAIVALILDKLNEVKNNPRFKFYESVKNPKNTLDVIGITGDEGITITVYYKTDGLLYGIRIADYKNEFFFNQSAPGFWKIVCFPSRIDSIAGIFISVYDILVKIH